MSVLSIDVKINRKSATVAGLECEQRREFGDQDDQRNFGRQLILDICGFPFYLQLEMSPNRKHIEYGWIFLYI